MTLNNLDGLRQTAGSVCSQNFKDFEWIVIDGGSQDGSTDYLRSRSARFVSEPDLGPYYAMNKGIARAQGDYLVFMNAGDRFANTDTLDIVKSNIELTAQLPDFVYGDFLHSSGKRLIRKRARPCKKMILGMPTSHQSMYYRRAFINDRKYDTSYRIAADYHFTCQILSEAQNVLYIPHALSVFETGGLSQKHPALGRSESARARRELGLCGSLQNIAIEARQAAGEKIRIINPKFFNWLRNLEGGRIYAGRTAGLAVLTKL